MDLGLKNLGRLFRLKGQSKSGGVPEAPVVGVYNTQTNKVEAQEYYPTITNWQTYSVAASGTPPGVKDFDNFHLAMIWLREQTTAGDGHIFLELEDGTHYTGATTDFDFTKMYHLQGLRCSIRSASYDQSLCRLTMPAADAGKSFSTWFVVHDCVFDFSYIEVDGTLGGYTRPTTITPFIFSDKTLASLYQSDISNTRSAFQAQGGTTVTWNTCDATNVDFGFLAQTNSKLYLTGSLTTANLGVDCQEGCTVLLDDAFTFNSVTTTCLFPLNEIQYDMALVGYENAAKTFKA